MRVSNSPKRRHKPTPRKRPLTKQQRIFVRQYVLTGSGKLAAIAAGINPRTAETRAERWRGMPQVQDYLRTVRYHCIRKEARAVSKRLATVMRDMIIDGARDNCRAWRRGMKVLKLWERLIEADRQLPRCTVCRKRLDERAN